MSVSTGNHIRVVPPPVSDVPSAVTNNDINSRVSARSRSPNRSGQRGISTRGDKKGQHHAMYGYADDIGSETAGARG